MLVEQVGPRGILCLLLSLDRFGEGANLLDDLQKGDLRFNLALQPQRSF